MTTPERDDEFADLATLLREERQEPDPAFAAELDRWAEAGFPHAERPGAKPSAGLRSRLALLPPRRVLATAGAAFTLLVVVGVGISQLEPTGSGDSDDSASGVAPTSLQEQRVPEAARGGGPDQGAAVSQAEGDLRSNLEGGATAKAAQPPARGHKIAQDVDLVLASEPEQIREVSDGVNAVVNRYRGFVVNSSVQSGDADRSPGAQFELRLPARTLQASLADLSELAHVQSRTEGTRDITEQFVSAREQIEENETARRSLLRRLEDATTEAEIDAIRAQLRVVNAQLAAARTDLARASQRVQLVPVAVSIVSEEGADSDGDWSIGDALDDAGQVLSTAAGIVVVAGAVLLPLALVAALVALAMRARISRSRDRALDD